MNTSVIVLGTYDVLYEAADGAFPCLDFWGGAGNIVQSLSVQCSDDLGMIRGIWRYICKCLCLD